MAGVGMIRATPLIAGGGLGELSLEALALFYHSGQLVQLGSAAPRRGRREILRCVGGRPEERDARIGPPTSLRMTRLGGTVEDCWITWV
jgi:hypothetical protein